MKTMNETTKIITEHEANLFKIIEREAKANKEKTGLGYVGITIGGLSAITNFSEVSIFRYLKNLKMLGLLKTKKVYFANSSHQAYYDYYPNECGIEEFEITPYRVLSIKDESKELNRLGLVPLKKKIQFDGPILLRKIRHLVKNGVISRNHALIINALHVVLHGGFSTICRFSGDHWAFIPRKELFIRAGVDNENEVASKCFEDLKNLGIIIEHMESNLFCSIDYGRLAVHSGDSYIVYLSPTAHKVEGRIVPLYRINDISYDKFSDMRTRCSDDKCFFERRYTDKNVDRSVIERICDSYAVYNEKIGIKYIYKRYMFYPVFHEIHTLLKINGLNIIDVLSSGEFVVIGCGCGVGTVRYISNERFKIIDKRREEVTDFRKLYKDTESIIKEAKGKEYFINGCLKKTTYKESKEEKRKKLNELLTLCEKENEIY